MNPYKTLRSVVRFDRVETDRIERPLARAASVEDLRRIAKRRLPGGVFDYIDGGAEDERTLAANQAAFAAVTYRPRVLRGLETVSTASTILGQPLTYPLVLAPTGARGPAVHAFDAQHPLDRRGPRHQRRTFVVPGLCVARPRPEQTMPALYFGARRL